MSRIFALVFLLATSSLAACADAATAPQRSLTPSAGPSRDLIDPGTCTGGWSSSEGRCL